MLTDYLFVYGTLRADAGHEMHRVLADGGTFEGGGRVVGTLYDLGSFPGAVPGGSAWVKGEAYRLREIARVLELLDRYEGCGPGAPEPHLFRRETVDVDLDGERTITAWIYWYQGSLADASLIPTGDYATRARGGAAGP